MGRGIKSVLQFSLYFVGIQIMSISARICNIKLSPTFLWVSKFDVKFGLEGKNFQNPYRQVTFIFCGLKVHFLNTRTCCNFGNHTRTQAPTVSLRGSGQIYTRGPKVRVYGWMDGWDGWDGISKVSFNFLHTFSHIEHVNIY